MGNLSRWEHRRRRGQRRVEGERAAAKLLAAGAPLEAMLGLLAAAGLRRRGTRRAAL